MKNKIKATSLLVALLLIVNSLLLGGCGAKKETVTSSADSAIENSSLATTSQTDNSANANQSGSSTVSSQASNSTLKGNLLFWDINNSITTKGAFEFETKNPGVKIKVENPAEITPSSLSVAISAGNAPDVVRLDHVYATSLGLKGLIADISSYGANNLKSKFVQSCWESSSVNDKVYGLPFDANTIALMYNKQLLSKAGKQPPKTYEELRDVCNAIKSTSAGAWGYTAPFGSTNKNWAAFQYFFWLWRMGGDILTSDNKAPAFNSEAGVSALQMLVNLSKDGLADKTYHEAEFYTGTVGMIDMGDWALKTTVFKDTNTFGVAPMPTLKSGVPGYSGLGLFVYSVVNGSKNKELAYKFTEFLSTNKDYQVKYCKDLYLIPSLIEAQKDSVYTSGTNAPVWTVYINQLNLSKHRPGVSNWNEVEKAIADAVTLAVNGTKTPKEALDAAAVTVQRLIK